MTPVQEIEARLCALSTPERVARARRFFKTGEGSYAQDDRFLGISVPVLRLLAREYQSLPLSATWSLLQSPFHEARLLALFVCIHTYDGGNTALRRSITSGYLSHKRHVNNWDLVDASAAHILGRSLATASCQPLYALVRSKSLWDRRIAVVATHALIRNHELSRALSICALVVDDSEDLMHKALGWTLREVGKRSRETLDRFLSVYASRLPRTALRYAIERHGLKERAYWMSIPRSTLSTTRGEKRKV
jgi:3-methyladenine DNA glycosylase AlkD